MFLINIFIKIKEFFDIFSDFVLRLIIFLEPKFPKKVLFFVDKINSAENVELIDAFSLFEKALEKNLKAYYLISKKSPNYKFIKKRYKNKIIEYSNIIHIKHFFKFLHLSKLITAYEFQSPYNSWIYNSPRMDLIFLQHGIILLKNNIFDIYNQNEFNKILISNNYEKEIVKNYGNFKEENLIKATLPRIDLLKNPCVVEKNILFFPTWRLSFSTIDYKNSLYYKSIMSLLQNQVLKDILDKNNVKLQFALHHSLIENQFQLGNIEFVDSSKLSDLIKKSSMLITDYSSVWSDFFFQNKPVIFYRFDKNDKNLIERDLNSMKFAESKNSLLFNICEDEKSLIELLEKYILNNFTLENEYKIIQDKFFYIKEDIREKILKEMEVL